MATDNQSIGRGLALLRAVGAAGGEATVTELARATGLSRTTATRLLASLERHGLVDRPAESERYVLGYELARLGRLADPVGGVVARSGSEMQALARATGETVTLALATPDGELDFVHQVDGVHLIGGRWWVGERFALHASSSGKLLLAEPSQADRVQPLPDRLERCAPRTLTSRKLLSDELVRIRRDGYAQTVDELEDGLAGISVAIRDDSQRLFAVLSVSGPSFRFDEAQRAVALEPLRQAAEALEAALFLRTTDLV